MALLLTLPEISSIPGGAVDAHRRIIADGGGSGGRKLRIAGCSLCPCSRVEDREVSIGRVWDPIRNLGFNPIFSVPMFCVSSASSQPPSLLSQQQQKDGGDDKQDYYVNLGYAIRTLREDYPVIFYKTPNFGIYRHDTVFKDPLNTFVGIENYKRIFSALRLIGSVLFKALWVDIVNVWQPLESTIMIRWTVHGIPRVPWESYGRFDGISIYKLDSKGKIFEHRVENIARNPPTRFKVMAVEELIQCLGGPSTPKPTYFKKSVSSVATSMPVLLGFMFIGYYFTLYLTPAL